MVVEVILLAAGASRRFGKQKLLHRLPSGLPIISQSIRNINQAGFTPTVIIRKNDSCLLALLSAEKCNVIESEKAIKGMGSSLAHAVQASSAAQGWIVCLADMPFIKPETIQQVHSCLSQGFSLCAPYYQNKHGHPVGFAARYFYELIALQGDYGARNVLLDYQTELKRIETEDPGIFRDIDIPLDLLH